MIELNNIPQVALDCLNKDHRDVADLINQLDSALNTTTAINNISETITQLYEHLENHFACEEHQMRKYGFPAYNIHQGEHQRVLNEVKSIHQQWQDSADNTILSHYYTDTFQPWLIEHIATLDTHTAQFIVDAGGH